MSVAIQAATPWARRWLTPDTRAAIAAMVPDRVTRIRIAAGRAPGDWVAAVHGRPGEDGIARHRSTVDGAVAAAVRDMERGAPLAWCSTCPEPALFQIDGEAYCAACERTRGGTIR